MRVDSVEHGELFGRNLLQKYFVFPIEILHRVARERCANAPASTDPAAPGLPCEGNGFIKDKHAVKAEVPLGPLGDERHVAAQVRMRPFWIMSEDQLFGRLRDRILPGQPDEMAREKQAGRP